MVSIPGLRPKYGLDSISDARLRERVVEMFDDAQRQIDDEGVDLVVLCARRLACLYQVMVAQGYEPLHGAIVVSDRFLDLASPWRWKNVLILDDSVVLGTTLANLHAQISRQLDEFGGGSVRTSAVCVDEAKNASFLLERVRFEGALPATTSQVEQFSTDVVTTLFSAGVPFFSDFPVTRRVRWNAKAALAHLREPGWHVADVTAPMFASTLTAAYVQIPDPTTDTLARLLSRMPPALSGLVDAFKLRMFVTRVATLSDDVAVSFVPLALLRACEEAELDAALATAGMTMGTGVTECLGGCDLDGPTKHRLVQFYASVFILHAMATQQMHNAMGDEPWLDRVSLGLFMGHHTDAVLRSLPSLRRFVDVSEQDHIIPSVRHRPANTPRSPLLDDDDLRSLLWEQRELLAAARGPASEIAAPDLGEMTKVGLMVCHAVNSIFGYIGEHFEISQQREIRSLGSYEAYAARFLTDPASRVLNQTMTMDELTSALWDQPSAPHAWGRAMVSLGIDMGNDLGIVVPSTQTDARSGLVYRGYRLGETAHLAQQPLVRWSGAGNGAFDDFVLAATNHPRMTVNVPISLPARSRWRHRPARTDNLQELRTWLVRYQPGAVVGRFDGVITGVDTHAGTFEADITNIFNLDIAQTLLGTDMVPDEQRELLAPGRAFHWTVFERSDGGPKYRTSRLRLAPRSQLRREDVDAALRDFSFLVDAD